MAYGVEALVLPITTENNWISAEKGVALGYSGRSRPGISPEFPVCRLTRKEQADHQRTI